MSHLAEQQPDCFASHFRGCLYRPRLVDSVNIEIRNSATNPTMRGVRFPPGLLTDGTIRGFCRYNKDLLRFGGVPSGNYFVVVQAAPEPPAIMSSVSVSTTRRDAGRVRFLPPARAGPTYPMPHGSSGTRIRDGGATARKTAVGCDRQECVCAFRTERMVSQ